MRRGAGILLAGVLVLGACSGDDDAVAPAGVRPDHDRGQLDDDRTDHVGSDDAKRLDQHGADGDDHGVRADDGLPPDARTTTPEDGTTEPRVEVGAIEIPAIGLSATMWEGIRLATLDNGPGHWPGTAVPGEVGNAVIAGHRVSHHADFRHLDDLVAGDDVIMTTPSGRFVYKVLSSEIVKPDALWVVDQTPEATATLFACHPPGSVRERIVVHLALSA